MGSTTIQYFEYAHLPEQLQKVSRPICELAHLMEDMLPDGPEKSAGMRKLLEAKDTFVRASIPNEPKLEPIPKYKNGTHVTHKHRTVLGVGTIRTCEGWVEDQPDYTEPDKNNIGTGVVYGVEYLTDGYGSSFLWYTLEENLIVVD